MRIITDIDTFPGGRRTALAVGIFDGFHVGHAAVIARLVETARESGLESCVLTFQTHPRRLLSGIRQDLITSPEHRLRLLARAGVDMTVMVDFSEDIARMDAKTFLRDVAIRRLGARAIVMGHDARLGRGGDMNPERLALLGHELGLETRCVGPVSVLGSPVSSTRVREAIQSGDLPLAEALLGRRVSVMGEIQHGDGRGRGLGFPTANINVHREVRPPWGVYATRSLLDIEEERWIPSATNVGPRPTYDNPEEGARRDLLVETFLLEPPPSDLYGRIIEVEFIRKIRDERRFSTNEELAAQIALDVQATREALAAEGLL